MARVLRDGHCGRQIAGSTIREFVMTRIVTMITAIAFAVPALCSGQDLLGSTRLEIDRVELTRLLAQYDAVAQSTAYSDVLRDEGRARADIIRDRLRIGDFRPGDQIALFIGGGSAVQWDTFHLFVVLYEEPHLRRKFGAEYKAYCVRVPRWLPRLRPAAQA